MKRPSNIQKFKPVDPKLGIKSSLPKSKSTIALVILLWLSNDKKYEIEYSETDGDKITISENCYDKLIQYLRNNIDIKGDSEEDIMNYVNENQLFHSQLESLIVALELVWRIASIKFKDSNKADSAERTGKKRFEKILSYTNNIDLFDTLIESNASKQLMLLATHGMLVKRPMMITHDIVLVGFKEADWEGALL